MSVDQLTNAIVTGINSGAEQFLEGTLAAVLPIIWLALLGLHLGRPYILSMIDRFTLRLGADLLWLIYIALRDFLIVSGVVMSFMFFFPDVVSTDQLPITGGLAAAALFGVNLGTYIPQATVVAPSSTRSTLQTNFNNLLTQISQLAGDSQYNGINLLTNGNLSVVFNENNTSSLQIQGVNDTAGGLGLSSLNNGEFQDNNSINTVISNINAAITSVRAQTQTFGQNSGTITTRQSFEQNTINTLQTGSSNLVLADQNAESADLLTEQTQQQLEISALSIANQANQSVLKLFP